MTVIAGSHRPTQEREYLGYRWLWPGVQKDRGQIVSALCSSFKLEAAFEAGHCLLPTSTSTVTAGVGTVAITNLVGGTTYVAVGMSASTAGIPSGTIVQSVNSTTQVTLSQATTAAVNAITFTADLFKMLLIGASPSITYDGRVTNVGTPGTGAAATTNVGIDEANGGGYTSGGNLLTNVLPILSNNAAVGSFALTSWTNASFSANGAIIYNTSARLGAVSAPLNNRAVSVHTFGGTQQVATGTFTVVPPTQDSVTGLLRMA